MSVVGGQPKNMKIPLIKQQNTSNTLFSSLIITSNRELHTLGRTKHFAMDSICNLLIFFLRNPFIQLIFKTVVFTI